MTHLAYTAGRILVPVVFIISGVQKALNIAGTARMLSGSGFPMPGWIPADFAGVPRYQALAGAVAAVEIVGGLMILAGFKARWAALVLFVFTAAATVLFHHFWTMTGDAVAQNMVQALKNLSIMGAMLLIFAGGSHGLDNRRP
jgi:putative oxidoreductase